MDLDRMDKRVIIGIAVAAGLIAGVALMTFVVLRGECGQVVSAFGGGIFDIIRECI